MKRIEHYCSAVDQIQHEPKTVEEVLAMKQENQNIKMKKGGKAFGAAIAAALVCANIAGGYWLINRNNTESLTTQSAAAPIEDTALVTTEALTTAAPAVTTVAETSIPENGREEATDKPVEVAVENDGDQWYEVCFDELADGNGFTQEMHDTVAYYAKSAVLMQNGNVLRGQEELNSLDGITLEIYPDEGVDAPADCELNIYSLMMMPEDESYDLLKEKHDFHEKTVLKGGKDIVIPLELKSSQLKADNKDWVLRMVTAFRPLDGTGEPVDISRVYTFTLAPSVFAEAEINSTITTTSTTTTATTTTTTTTTTSIAPPTPKLTTTTTAEQIPDDIPELGVEVWTAEQDTPEEAVQIPDDIPELGVNVWEAQQNNPEE